MDFNVIGEFFSNSYAVAAWTLIATVVIGTTIPWIFYSIEQSKREPWSLEKKEGNLWELTRTRSKQAFIHQVYGDGLCYSDFTVAFRGLGGLGTLSRSYGNNEKLIVEISPLSDEYNPTSAFHICYTEHRRKRRMKLPKFIYNANTSNHELNGRCKNKHWSRPLY